MDKDDLTLLQEEVSNLTKQVASLSNPKDKIEQKTILTDQEKKKIVDSFEYSTQVTLVAGTATISNGRFSPNSVVVATPQTIISTITAGVTVYHVVSASCTGGSCTINSSSALDTRTINVRIFI